MKATILLAVLLGIISNSAIAQEGSSSFRKKYIRFGIQSLDNKTLDHSLKPADNMIKGNFGTGTGGVFEAGRYFYFIGKEKAKMINAGIDWTIFSITYNPSAKAWKNYATANSSGEEDFTLKFVGSIATKAGAVVSINPIQKLVVDVRIQAKLSAFVIGPLYEPLNNDVDYFYTYKDDPNATGLKKYTQYLSNTGIQPNIGATVRWGTVGIAVDYAPGKIKMNYTRNDNGIETYGTTQIPINSLQVKLNLTM